MLIISADQFYSEDGIFYCRHHSFKSLSQYWNIDKTNHLCGIQVFERPNLSEWEQCPNSFTFIALNNVNSLKINQRRQCRKSVAEAAQSERLTYIRMPDFRVFSGYKIARKYSSIFCEYHGDWAESMLVQKPDRNEIKSVAKWLASPVRAKQVSRYYHQICRDAVANVSIGPVLAEKYQLNKKPLLITTNHTVGLSGIVDSGKQADGLFEILFVGELQERKGLSHLFEALAEMSSRNFKLKVIGDGHLASRLKEQVDTLKLNGQVSFLGAIYDKEALEAHMRASHLFVLPSIAGEGVPRVLQEAQSAGCVCIATDVGSTSWQLKDEGGLLIEPKSATALRKAIESLMIDPSLYARLSVNSVRNAKLFCYERQRQGIENFIRTEMGQLLDEA